MKKKGLGSLACLIALGLVAAGLLVVRAHKPRPRPVLRPIQLRKGDLRLTVSSTGVVKPKNRLAILPPIAGRAESILVSEGQAVKKGQVLALISSNERAALLDSARAKGDAELKRWEGYYKPTPLLAPLPGIIIARAVEPGQSVATSDSVLVLSDRLIIKAQVDETDIGKVRLGQACDIVLDAFSGTLTSGRVCHIAYEAETVSNVTIYTVEVLPDSVPAFMRSGMTATLRFEIASRKGVLLAPSAAIRQQEDGSSVVLAPDAQHPQAPRWVAVETGLSQGDFTELVSGFHEGETILLEELPPMQAADGTSSLFMPKRPGGDKKDQGPPPGGGGGPPPP